MSIKITGLDELMRQLKEAQTAISSLDGTIAELRFNPADPQSVEDAVAQMEAAVDEKVAPYQGNPMVMKLASATKETFAKALREKAVRSE